MLPERPQTTKNTKRKNIETDYSSIQVLSCQRGYLDFHKPEVRTTKSKTSKKTKQKPHLNGTEKCPRSIKRRPKSSRLFMGKKNIQRPVSKYRSDYYPENKVNRVY